MAGKKFSYSRLGTYNDCKRKYFLKYIEGWYRDYSVPETAKGLAFHKFAETYMERVNSIKRELTEEEIIKLATDCEEQFPNGKAYYPLLPKAQKWVTMYISTLKPILDSGGKIEQECWLNGNIADVPFCGQTDILITPKDPKEKIWIIDYKTPKTANASSYKGQLFLYAYMVCKMRGIPLETVKDRMNLAVFFPFCDEEDGDKCLKLIRFKPEDVQEKINEIENTVKDINEYGWKDDPFDIHPSDFGCKFCDFLGHPTFCPHSKEVLGFLVPRGAKFYKK